MGSEERKLACITLDLEHDYRIPDEQRNPTFEYINDYIEMVKQLDIPISVFVVGKLLEWKPAMIERFQSKLEAEFHLHSYKHEVTRETPFEQKLTKGMECYEAFFGNEPVGYRAPQGNIIQEELKILKQYGFDFDSSIFPSYRPGVYNNLRKPTTPYYPTETDELLELPFTVCPKLRVPIAQNYLKLLGRPYQSLLKTNVLPNLIIFDSHVQDFYKTEYHDHIGFPLNHLITRNLHRSKEIFSGFINYLKSQGYQFVTISEIYKQYS